MHVLCEQIRFRLLSEDRQKLSSEELEHIEVCPECRELGETLQKIEPVLQQAAHQTAQLNPASLNQQLDRRVQDKLRLILHDRKSFPDRPASPATHGRLNGSARKGGAINPSQVKKKPGTAGGSRGKIITLFRQPRRAWAVAAVFIMGFSLLVLHFSGSGNHLGYLDYPHGDVHVIQASGNKLPVGNLELELVTRGMVLETAANSGAIIRLVRGDKRYITVLLDQSSRIRFKDNDHVRLLDGKAWFSVNPQGKGFNVSTNAGDVKVTGTVFGVSVEGQTTRVDVTRGSVSMSRNDLNRTIKAGQMVESIGNEGLSEPAERSAGLNDPYWVNGLHDSENSKTKGEYFPSIGP
jgi:hypothetical protein